MADTEDTEIKDSADSPLGTPLDSIVAPPAESEAWSDQSTFEGVPDPTLDAQGVAESGDAITLESAAASAAPDALSSKLRTSAERSAADLGLGAAAQQRSGPTRELAASALVHLLGIATNKQLIVLEEKMDMINTKLSSLIAKLDKMSTQFSTAFSETYLDRIDFQLSEVRTVLRKLHQPGAAVEQLAGSEQGDSSVKRAVKP